MVLNRCRVCKNLNPNTEKCNFCNFEYNEIFKLESDDWDIFGLDDELEWSHLQIMYRLKAEGIECLSADIWFDENLAIVIGADASKGDVASALNVNEKVVYDLGVKPLYIINLFEEKYLRGMDLDL